MSLSRPGKRPRGMEGSTIVVPAQQQQPPPPASGGPGDASSLIVMLAKSCQKHRAQHDKVEQQQGEAVSGERLPADLCERSLESLRKILPKVERAYGVAAHPKATDVRHLCDFYGSVVQRRFCPSALELFGNGAAVQSTFDLMDGSVSFCQV